ncbi:MAG: two-component regulator propeller domain-containing protein [Chitinispirillia bacterium]|jgi:ligand-binding sensor domain-containing protein
MKSNYGYMYFYLWIILFLSPFFVFGNSPFFNYVSTVEVSDILLDDNYTWVTTKGGLIRINQNDHNTKLFKNNEQIPDLQLTALCKDSSGNLWIGSRKGFLYQITPRGRINKYDSYILGNESGKWRINDILSYGKYLIIGAKNGMSIFDTELKSAYRNVTSFNGLKPPVYAVFINKNTLYVSLGNGIAKLDISGKPIQDHNFANESIWSIDKSFKEIISFPILNDSISFFSEITAVWKNSIIKCFKNSILSDTIILCDVPSQITSLKIDRNSNLWIGTSENYIYKWDGNKLLNYKINGLTYNNINRVFAAKNGWIWCIPKVNKNIETDSIPWWQGVASFTGTKWNFYSKHNTSNFGNLGDGSDFFGICEDNYGNMWFGTNGTNVKKFNREKNYWNRYYIGTQNKSTFKFNTKHDTSTAWGKCDAIAQDSSGWLWFSSYKSNKGSIFCYNPGDEKLNYRYFFPADSNCHISVPLVINVDAAGRIFVGGDEDTDGKLVVFDHNGDPYKNGINTPLYNGNFDKVWDMASVSNPADSGTWIITTKGLYHYQFHHTMGSIFTLIQDETKEKPTIKSTCIEVEHTNKYRVTDNQGNLSGDSAKIESVLWLGTQQNGLAQVFTNLIVKSDGSVERGSIDSIKVFNEAENGLANDFINHLDIDRKNGYLWLATEGGLSRYFLGHKSKKIESNEEIAAYPNPYSFSRHREIVFENLAPGSSVSIFSVDGKLVANIIDIGNNVRKTINQWTYFWKPDSRIIPGTYFYSASMQQNYGNNREKGNVGKLLIIP